MDDKCVMCQQEAETRDHIFFGYPFAVTIWKEILRKCGLQRESLGWEGKLKWVSDKRKSIDLYFAESCLECICVSYLEGAKLQDFSTKK